MKKLTAFLALILCAVCPLTACNDGKMSEGPDTASSNAAITETPTDLSTGTPTEIPTEAPTEPETLSPEEQLATDRTEYLSTVTYRDFVLTGSEEPYYMGRWFEKTINGVTHKVTTTDGSHLYFLVEGAASVDVNFTVITRAETPYFAYSIDGGEPVRQLITQPTVTLPDTGRHTVRIIADGMTESEQKWRREIGFALKDVVPAEGGSICGIMPTEPVIFFYGDSITEGIRALNMNATSDGNSATNAYSWQCAESLGVTPYLVGYGATGIISVGSFNTMLNAIDSLSYDRLVEDGVCDVTPDIIVINHGCNDGGTADADFEAALTETLTRLREKYPDTPIVYLIPFAQAKAEAIRRVVGDTAYIVETADWPITYTDGIHPDAAGARVAGERLAEELKNIFGADFFASKAE